MRSCPAQSRIQMIPPNMNPSHFPASCNNMATFLTAKREHSSDCRERFDNLIRGDKFTFPKGVAKGVDSWKLEDDKLIRFHHIKRKKLFNPIKCDECPVKFKRLGTRTTVVKHFDNGKEETLTEEHWKGSSKSPKAFWTGRTEFELLPESDEVVPGAVIRPNGGEQQAMPRPIKGRKLTQKQMPAYGTLIEFSNFVAVLISIWERFQNLLVYPT